jgi:hypothetical protein
MPVTRVSGSPSLNVSMVWSIHGTPMFDLIRSRTCRAVRLGAWAFVGVGATISVAVRMTAMTAMATALERMESSRLGFG